MKYYISGNFRMGKRREKEPRFPAAKFIAAHAVRDAIIKAIKILGGKYINISVEPDTSGGSK